MRSHQAASVSNLPARRADAMNVSTIATRCRRRERVGIGADQPGGKSSRGFRSGPASTLGSRTILRIVHAALVVHECAPGRLGLQDPEASREGE